MPLLASIRNKRKKNCSLVFFFPNHFPPLTLMPKDTNELIYFPECLKISTISLSLLGNISMPWYYYSILYPMKNNFLQTDILKILEQQICVSSRNVYVMAHHDLAWKSSDVGIWDIRDGLMGWCVGRTVFSQSIKSYESGCQCAFSMWSWCCSGHTAVADSIRKAI